jgi:nitrogen regulatory protein PII-like uncharacterized protein
VLCLITGSTSTGTP